MNLTELRKEIERLQKYKEYPFFNGWFKGIKQTVESIDKLQIMNQYALTETYEEWQKIKKLLNLTYIQKGEGR